MSDPTPRNLEFRFLDSSLMKNGVVHNELRMLKITAGGSENPGGRRRWYDDGWGGWITNWSQIDARGGTVWWNI